MRTDIRQIQLVIGHIGFARDGEHRIDDRELGHIRWAHLRVDHNCAAGREVGHELNQ